MKALSALFCALLAAPLSAAAVTVDFSHLTANMSTLVSPTIGGINFSAKTQHIFAGSLGPNNYGPNMLASYLNSYNSTLTLTAAGGGTFSLQSLDAACSMFCTSNTTLVMKGYFADGSTLTRTDTAFEEIQKAYYNEFLLWTGLSKVEISTTRDTYVFFKSFDVDVSPVPEPGTWAMLLAGLGVLAAMRRRQAR